MKRALLVLAAAGTLVGQSGVGRPLAGFIRDADGALRPVFGIAGNLVAGRAVAHGVLAAGYSGRNGWAQTAEGWFRFGADGVLHGPAARQRLHASPPPLVWEADTLVLARPGGAALRAAVQGPVLSIEQMGEDWFHVRQPGRGLAVRATEDRLEVFPLPEAAQ